jgi:hypothetical protein
MSTRGLRLLTGIFVLSFMVTAAGAQESAPAPGSKITPANWRQYRQYMPEGMQALFSGGHFWKLPSSAEMVIGPPSGVEFPRSYATATEKYKGQVRLVRQPEGGVEISGYVAGQPFPDAAEPNKGIKILYNYWYHYLPAIVYTPIIKGWAIDRYGNVSTTQSIEVWNRYLHLSDPAPVPRPNDTMGEFETEYAEQFFPEQAKYTSFIQILYDDIARPQEEYVFLPSLRRSLRLSAAARCSPLLGTDYTPDDTYGGFFGRPTTFQVKYLGDAKVLTFVPKAGTNLLETANYDMPVFWPHPVLGSWTLRDAFVLDIRKLPAFAAGYCYGKRIMYIDKQTHYALWVDTYDSSLKLWKSFPLAYFPVRVPGGGTAYDPAGGWFPIWDFQNLHLSGISGFGSVFNTDAPAKFRDFQRYGTPSGLLQVMQ